MSLAPLAIVNGGSPQVDRDRVSHARADQAQPDIQAIVCPTESSPILHRMVNPPPANIPALNHGFHLRWLETAVVRRIAMGRPLIPNSIRSQATKLVEHLTPGFEKAMLRIAFVCLAAAMLFDPGRDTLQVSGASFAVTLALASVTFSYGRTLKDGSAIRDEVIFAGEKLVVAAVVFLFASILKHASHDVPRYMDILFEILRSPKGRTDFTFFGHNIVEIVLSIMAFLFFLLGLLYAQMGIFLVNNIAGHRMKRRPGYDDDVIPSKSFKSFRHRMTELDEIDSGAAASDQKPQESTPAI
jgi:hypothetical protein